MKRNYRDKAEAKMKMLGVTTQEIAEQLDKPSSRISEAMSGSTERGAAMLRVYIDQILTGLTRDRRSELEAEIEAARDVVCPELEGRLSVIMPEDLVYIVTEDGIPVGVWIPETKTFKELDDVILPLVRKSAQR